MKRMILKDTFREIKHSFGRFFSIFAITLLGVAFFTGLVSSERAMKYNADLYFDETNYYDLHLLSTIGFTKEEVEEVKKIKGVKGVLAVQSLEVSTSIQEKELTLTVLPVKDNIKSEDSINRAHLIKGRMPQKQTECVVEEGFLEEVIKIGDTISFTSNSTSPLEVSISSCKVVGMVHNPLYLSFSHGNSKITGNKIDAFIMVQESVFKEEYSTDLYITVEGASSLNSYTKDYFSVVEIVSKRIEKKSVEMVQNRIEDVKKQAIEKLNESKNEYEQKKVGFDEEIKAKEEELEKGKQDILLGKVQIEMQKSSYEQKVEMSKMQIESAKANLASGRLEYENKKNQFEQVKNRVEQILPPLRESLETYNKKIESSKQELEEIEKKLTNPDISDIEKNLYEKQKETLRQSIDISEKYLNMVEVQIENARKELLKTENSLIEAKQKIDLLEQTISNGEKDLQNGELVYKREIQKAERELQVAEQKIKEGENILSASKEMGEKELVLNYEKLQKAEKKLNQKTEEKWYVLDRNSDYSYVDYKGASDRMKAIASVFPIFFFLVAALVCLTTITRMVEEQRNLIGTYKALGYSKGSIALKYMIYAFSASILGGILGSFLGMIIFPKVIYETWNIMYKLPSYHYVFYKEVSLLAIFLFSLVSLITAFLSVYHVMMEVPSTLMRPKSPKEGKKIILEKIPFIWNHLSFLKKVTARNIFRYKKRFLMTIIGISGCTALLVAGYGIKDSIKGIVSIQFGEIFKYDAIIDYEIENTYSTNQELYVDVKNNKLVKNAIQVMQKNGTLKHHKQSEDITLVIPENLSDFKSFVTLRERKTGKQISLDDNGIVITEKLAKALSVKKGDSLTLTIEDSREYKVIGITENYIGHYVYMTPSLYKDNYSECFSATSILFKMKEQQEEVLRKEWMNKDGIASVNFYTSVADNFEHMIASLTIVTVVLLIAAGLLAFIVLYNLTNVNVSERVREIATIKVLGFYDKEVYSYVFRENIILTVIGSIVGLLLGTILHAFIMDVAELDNVMFGRNITWISFILSFIITIVFALLVNVCMRRKIKKISMVESLKSVD